MILNRNMLGKNLTELTTASCQSRFEVKAPSFHILLFKNEKQKTLEFTLDSVIKFSFRSQQLT